MRGSLVKNLTRLRGPSVPLDLVSNACSTQLYGPDRSPARTIIPVLPHRHARRPDRAVADGMPERPPAGRRLRPRRQPTVCQLHRNQPPHLALPTMRRVLDQAGLRSSTRLAGMARRRRVFRSLKLTAPPSEEGPGVRSSRWRRHEVNAVPQAPLPCTVGRHLRSTSGSTLVSGVRFQALAVPVSARPADCRLNRKAPSGERSTTMSRTRVRDDLCPPSLGGRVSG